MAYINGYLRSIILPPPQVHLAQPVFNLVFRAIRYIILQLLIQLTEVVQPLIIPNQESDYGWRVAIAQAVLALLCAHSWHPVTQHHRRSLLWLSSEEIGNDLHQWYA